jgi:cystathionine gamma-synthase
VRGQAENALTLARALAADRRVLTVHYPGLESHPGHALAARQMDGGYGGVVSFQVPGDAAAALAVVARTAIFTRATSLGGVESLIEHRASIEGPRTTTPPNLIRLSVGLENAGDLVRDLDQALGS